MTIRKTPRLILLAGACLLATALIGAREQGTANPAQTAALTQAMPVDPADHAGPAAERAALLHPRQQEAGEARRAAARRQGRARSSKTTTSRAGAFRRAHGLQRHAALPQAARSCRSSSRSACASAPTSTPTRASTRRSTCCRSRPTSPRRWTGRC